MTHYYIVDAIPHRGSLLFYARNGQLTNFFKLAKLYESQELVKAMLPMGLDSAIVPPYLAESNAFRYISENKLWTPELITGLSNLPDKQMTEKECYKFFKFTLETICKIEENLPYRSVRLGGNRSARNRADPHEQTITAIEVFKIGQAAGWKCVYYGCKLEVGTRVPNVENPAGISVDRIDSSKGYLLGNVQVICNQANAAKGTKTHRQFLTECRKRN